MPLAHVFLTVGNSFDELLIANCLKRQESRKRGRHLPNKLSSAVGKIVRCCGVPSLCGLSLPIYRDSNYELNVLTAMPAVHYSVQFIEVGFFSKLWHSNKTNLIADVNI